tara:strand:- start:52 stop:492 length:441 start_codon:yes stop_codon:yes gene_type:complete
MTKTLGERVVLNIELYDPRDVFRGDYVALNFTQERVQAKVFDMPEEGIRDLYNKKLYALLEKNEAGVWQVQSVQVQKPEEGLYIKCRLNYYNDHSSEGELDFGIDRYYVQTNTGRPIEDAARQGQLLAEVKVWNGQLVMTNILFEE